MRGGGRGGWPSVESGASAGADAGAGNDGKAGKGIEGGGPGAAIARAQGLVEAETPDFEGCGDGSVLGASGAIATAIGACEADVDLPIAAILSLTF